MHHNILSALSYACAIKVNQYAYLLGSGGPCKDVSDATEANFEERLLTSLSLGPMPGPILKLCAITCLTTI